MSFPENLKKHGLITEHETGFRLNENGLRLAITTMELPETRQHVEQLEATMIAEGGTPNRTAVVAVLMDHWIGMLDEMTAEEKASLFGIADDERT